MNQVSDNKNIRLFLSALQTKGNLAYEYNPLHNYQTEVDLFKANTDIGEVIFPKDCAVCKTNGMILTKKTTRGSDNEEISQWVDRFGVVYNDVITTENKDVNLYATAGSLIDLDTEQLNFDLEHPVDIEVQPSYDGSVNLILNDDKNIPRLINSRFSARELNTYEIVDRIGENDTNVYNSKNFDKDTSLYFQYEESPQITYLNYIQGVLPVGSYCFYFTYCDADENESDYIAESGIIPVFLGNDADYTSMTGGIKNQNSHKGIKLKLTNLTDAYSYLKVYYVRYFADYQQNRVFEAKKIYKKYAINSSVMYLQITGNEQAEDIDANILNISRFNPNHLLTQAQCKNMLFFGNIVKNVDNYKELQDCALRIIPEFVQESFERTNLDYNNVGYYDSKNIYNKVGYFPNEYYRFGVVFIYNNGTLSNVYNTLGYDSQIENQNDGDKLKIVDNSLFDKPGDQPLLIRKYIKIDDKGWIKDDDNIIEHNKGKLNARGVVHTFDTIQDNEILGVKFNIPDEVTKFLKEDLGIRGLFFVRQKCVPTLLAQCLLIPMDEVLEAPVLKLGDNDFRTECFVTDSNLISNNYKSRLYKYSDDSSISKHAYAAICPDFLLNQPYYNQIFNSSSFRIEQISNDSNRWLSSKERMYKFESGNGQVAGTGNPKYKVTICSVTEDVPNVAIQDCVYRLEMGEAEEAYRFKFAEIDNGAIEDSKDNAGVDSTGKKKKKKYYYYNIVRGKYSPYLAVYSDKELNTCALYNIYADIQNSEQEFQNRMDSHEPFYAISDRYNFSQLIDRAYYRGDCYLNTFTYRLNRNFNDPSLPNNDQIIDPNTWKNNYLLDDQPKWAKISRSDINAVQMGSWITFQVRSAMNYALRSEDHSNVAEEALMGQPRSYFPKNRMLYRGSNKMPDSYVFNDAYRATLGFKCYFTLDDINYIKDTFSNRIQYSAISIQDSFKNNYRYSLSTYFRDYSQEYGSITKLIGFEGYLLVIFEHAIGVAVINERILAGGSDGEPVFINTQNVLPEELTIISDTYGTQWGESVIKSEAGYVYGVDTIAKKIWRVKGQQIEILSDFKVGKFLIENITLGERENHPIISLKNVKTHYNNNKKDIMFTFYDDIYKDEEKVWNLCYNELLESFVTFYSWVPSYSANIDTQFFTFNRDTSKWLSLLDKCNYANKNNYGVVIDSPVISNSAQLYYRVKNQKIFTIKNNNDETVKNVSIEVDEEQKLKNVNFKLEHDHWGNYKLFTINDNTISFVNNKENVINELLEKRNITVSNSTDLDHKLSLLSPIYLEITPTYTVDEDKEEENANDNIIYFKTETICLVNNTLWNNIVDLDNPNLTTDFFIHGRAGIFDIKENIYPTRWYGKTHPFEFEFVVNDSIGQQKIYDNLILISNKAEPESFHFEIEGDNYEFSEDKRTMYFRQEFTKNIFQESGSDIIYNRKYTDVMANLLTKEQHYRSKDSKYTDQYFDFSNHRGFDRVYPIYSEKLVQQVKSTIFPLYYERIDTFNDIYHKYQQLTNQGYDYQNLSGSEIKWDRDLNQFNIVTHIKNCPINIVGRLRGNSFYKEGKWNIQIPSIIFMQKNETDWSSSIEYEGNTINLPPAIINSNTIPEGVKKITIDNIIEALEGNIESANVDIKHPNEFVQVGQWTHRKETKIRDKWLKVRVRYSGNNLAIIHSIITLYKLSYS